MVDVRPKNLRVAFSVAPFFYRWLDVRIKSKPRTVCGVSKLDLRMQRVMDPLFK